MPVLLAVSAIIRLTISYALPGVNMFEKCSIAWDCRGGFEVILQHILLTINGGMQPL